MIIPKREHWKWKFDVNWMNKHKMINSFFIRVCYAWRRFQKKKTKEKRSCLLTFEVEIAHFENISSLKRWWIFFPGEFRRLMFVDDKFISVIMNACAKVVSTAAAPAATTFANKFHMIEVKMCAPQTCSFYWKLIKAMMGFRCV